MKITVHYDVDLDIPVGTMADRIIEHSKIKSSQPKQYIEHPETFAEDVRQYRTGTANVVIDMGELRMTEAKHP